MISPDMKYTALYWALGYVEEELDVYCKSYKGYRISIDAEAQTVDYGKDISVLSEELLYLKRHQDFVVLECVDRLLSKGYTPHDIRLVGGSGNPDIIVDNVNIYCVQWGKDYEIAEQSFDPEKGKICVLYTSRLVSGLLEYKNRIFLNGKVYNYGIFEDGVLPFEIKPLNMKATGIEKSLDISDFEIYEDELVNYKGKSKSVRVPEGIKTIGAGAFWNNTYVEEVVLPDSLEILGGDCFYYCTALKKTVIPHKVNIMGNNPFAGCPNLLLDNRSPNYVLEDGVLYNKDKTQIIYYAISKREKVFKVPDCVICLGKHCFYACDNLEKIVIPKSVIKFENNPFSGCTKLSVENSSPYYYFDNGVIYNKFKTTIIGCLNGSKIDRLVVPETVTLISRNAFWNCRGVKNIVITKNVNHIGYNPFAGCRDLLLESKSSLFTAKDGIIYNNDLTQILCVTSKSAGKKFCAPDSAVYIGRSAFSGCEDLRQIQLNNVTYIDKSAFTNCRALEEIYIPDGVVYIGEWAFAYCINLKKVSVSRKTVIDKNAFNGCPVKIEWRN